MTSKGILNTAFLNTKEFHNLKCLRGDTERVFKSWRFVHINLIWNSSWAIFVTRLSARMNILNIKKQEILFYKKILYLPPLHLSPECCCCCCRSKSSRLRKRRSNRCRRRWARTRSSQLPREKINDAIQHRRRYSLNVK